MNFHSIEQIALSLHLRGGHLVNRSAKVRTLGETGKSVGHVAGREGELEVRRDNLQGERDELRGNFAMSGQKMDEGYDS